MLISFLTIALTIFFSLLSTAVISYVAMATPIGPWMEMTLVLVGTIILRIGAQQIAIATRMNALTLATAAGGISGAVAMACAFSFPTLYFLDTDLFNEWLCSPFYFAAFLAALVIAAGSFGLLLAHQWQNSFLHDDSMIFPIGQMVHNMIAIQNQLTKAVQLAYGALVALLYSIAQTFALGIPSHITLLPALNWHIFSIPHVTAHTNMLPMFCAIGFITGHVIAIPLLIAVIVKLALVDPVHQLFFLYVNHSDYILAFGAGMVLQGAIAGLGDIRKFAEHCYGWIIRNNHCSSLFTRIANATNNIDSKWLCLFFPFIFLSFYSFSLVAQFYLFAFTALCAYQLLIIAGKLGIAPLGRFATFVMIPGLLFFGFDSLQITLLATFVEIACIVAVDSMFGHKVAQLGSINHNRMMRYQWLGLIISACSIGIVFWLLISHFDLGSEELIVARAQSRALLIKAFNFDYLVMLLGFLFSYSLKLVRINPTLVFGGLLMGLDTSLMLIAGGLSTYLVKNKEEHYPFWSGVYATNSLWVFIRMLW